MCDRGIDAKLEYNDGHKTVDIALLDSRIFIEVDGLHHSTNPDQILRDFKRGHYSDIDGFDTFYVTNHTIENHLNEVARALTQIANRRTGNKSMKIYVLGSTTFMREMVQAKDDLISLGFDGWIHPDYEAFVRGEKQSILEKAKTEHAAVKRENNYLKVHYKHILESDAILIINGEKNGIKNYIGGNVLIEMGQAYVNNKIIFLFNDIPTNFPYTAEIECMDPVCLHGDLNNLLRK